MNEKAGHAMGGPKEPKGTPPATNLPAAETPPKAKGAKKADPRLGEIRFDKLPASILNLLQEVPWKEYGKLKLFFPTIDESMELAHLVGTLEHVMKVSPGKCFARMRKEEVKVDQVDMGYREIRDAIGRLEDAIRNIADLAQMEVKAFTQPTQKKPAGPKSQAG